MTSTRKTSVNELNEIFTNTESQSESGSEFEDESETDEYSDSDAESSMDVSEGENTLSLCGSAHASRLWKQSNFRPKLFQFRDNDRGITCDLNGETPLDFFKLFFDETLMHIIVKETNKFQANSSDKHTLSSSHRAKWSPTNAEEIYLFLAVFMLMAHMKKFRIKDYWSTDYLIATPVFSDIMPRHRFLLLLKFLHFNDNLHQPEGDRLYKIKPVVQNLKQELPRIFIPYQNLCVDESLILCKGRFSSKQYIPSKRNRFRIKLFVLCDCRTGYVLDFVVYMGSQTQIQLNKELGISGLVAMTLVTPYLQKGHNLFMDNWYSSPILFEQLHANSTGVCGTVRQNRLGMPNFTRKLKKGDTDYWNTNILLAVKWFGKREVTMLSIIHEAKMMNTGKLIGKLRNKFKNQSLS